MIRDESYPAADKIEIIKNKGGIRAAYLCSLLAGPDGHVVGRRKSWMAFWTAVLYDVQAFSARWPDSG